MTLQHRALTASGGLHLSLGPVEILRRGEAQARLIAGSAPEPCYHLIFPMQAPLQFCQSGLTGDIRPGGYVLLRGDRFYELRSASDLAQWVAVLPARALQDRLVAADTHVGGRFRPDPQMAALVSRTISATAQVFRSGPPPRPEALAAEIVALAALMLGAEEDGGAPVRSGRTRTRQRIMEHIERHLPDPELTPDSIARAMGISRSYLYALFADGGETVSGFVRSRRLQAAYELLVGDAKGGLAISEVAYRTGFRSAAHFSRSFSRRFQATPRDIRAGASR
ncbi:helix-turn-helix domain-containing protein [Citreicella sp. C3M06]|uniref:helix-turn-helix domain-containing protein n=1 Tax=Citreicella sp. C3M06 TaxID=2841564 RepID=UPI001C0A6123|nr:helix-turn-helix domain-containing protein [Citreicella sp. C3M06]MBU2959978.1 helix-turn-helix domain-containing protein [Citreicella sp. C3M06]